MPGVVVVNQPEVFLTDGTNVVALVQDGSIYRVAADVKIADLGGAATEATLVDIEALLTSLDGKDFATQTTLAALLSAFTSEDFATEATLAGLRSDLAAEDFATEATLATRATEATAASIDTVLKAIRDTAGVKKITDALPVGDNVIGRAKITDGADVVTVIDDLDNPSTEKRLQVQAELKPGSTVVIAPSAGTPDNLRAEDLKATGGSADMNVNGSVTPVVFKVSALPVNDTVVSELRMIISGPKTFHLDGNSFGEHASGLLANGILIEAVINGGTLVELINIKRNEGLFRLASTTGLNVLYAQGGANEMVVASFIFGGRTVLSGGTTDQVRITIRDDLLPGGPKKIKHFRATLYGVEEVP